MNINDLNSLRGLLFKTNKTISSLEFTKNNYDDFGNLLDNDLPTFTTDFCEIGLSGDEIYFVFIMESKLFNIKLFDELKNKINIKIYGFVDFKNNLFPSDNFNFDVFLNKIREDKYLQIQFSFNNIQVSNLFKEYCDLVNIFKKNNTKIINQLKVNLTH